MFFRSFLYFEHKFNYYTKLINKVIIIPLYKCNQKIHLETWLTSLYLFSKLVFFTLLAFEFLLFQ